MTFAAFGNGAPDIFSSLAAFSNSESGGLAFGELLGAAMFILTVVMGVVAIISPVSRSGGLLKGIKLTVLRSQFPVAKFPFFRDIAFFMGALVVILSMLGDKSINMVESVILVCTFGRNKGRRATDDPQLTHLRRPGRVLFRLCFCGCLFSFFSDTDEPLCGKQSPTRR